MDSTRIIKSQTGFTFIEVIIATLMMLMVVAAVVHFNSRSGSANNQKYYLKAVEVLKAEVEKLEALYEINQNYSEFDRDGTNYGPPPSEIFLFRYTANAAQVGFPDKKFRVYYDYPGPEEYPSFVKPLSVNNNTINDYHTYYENKFNSLYAALSDEDKVTIDLRTYTYCTYFAGDDDTDWTVGSKTAAKADASIVVIDDMGSPDEPEDDLLGYIGWWINDTAVGTKNVKEITVALQFWYPGTDWTSVDPEVIVMKNTMVDPDA